MKKLMIIVLSVTLATQLIIASHSRPPREGCVTLEGFGNGNVQGLFFHSIPVDLVNDQMKPIKRLTVESGKSAQKHINESVKSSGITDYSKIQRVLILRSNGTIMIRMQDNCCYAVGSFNKPINA